MPKAVIEFSEHTNRIVNVVKAKQGLKSKSEAIEFIVEEYEEKILDPPFRPEFVEEVLRSSRGPFRKIHSFDELFEGKP